MARSFRSTPGRKQTYNLYDQGDLTRALKAINERIKEFEREFGKESQLYRDYVAPLKTISLQNNVRVDKQGRMQFKTGKGQNVEQVKDAVRKMLTKATKGEVIESTRERLGAAKKVGGKGFMTYDELKRQAEEFRLLYHEIDSLLQEIYELAGRDGSEVVLVNELNIGYILEGNWGSLSKQQLEEARDKMKEWIRENRARAGKFPTGGTL